MAAEMGKQLADDGSVPATRHQDQLQVVATEWSTRGRQGQESERTTAAAAGILY
jgi:hypothetical protein